jgi:phosphohistidine phosphatase
MFLYLIQHGEAVSKDKDPERPLSSTGVEEVGRVAAYVAANCGVVVGTSIHHSGKLRARQTAEIIATALNLPGPEQADGLKPMDDPAIWQSRLANSSQNQVLVGHLPYMSRLASLLLIGDPGKNIVQFKMGGIVALKRDEDLWSLQWQIVPDIIPA